MEEYLELLESLNDCIDSKITSFKIVTDCCDSVINKTDRIFLAIMYREVGVMAFEDDELEAAKEYLKAGLSNCKCYNCGC